MESQEGKRLAEGLVKQMTGGVDHIKARFLFQEYFSLRRSLKRTLAPTIYPSLRILTTPSGSVSAVFRLLYRSPKSSGIKTWNVRLPRNYRVFLPGRCRAVSTGASATTCKGPRLLSRRRRITAVRWMMWAAFLQEVCILGDPNAYKVQVNHPAPRLSSVGR